MKQYKVILTVITIGIAISYVNATNGIAVSEQWEGTRAWNDYNGFGRIVKYIIENDDVVSADTIFDGEARQATINVSGTYVAFFNRKADADYVSVIDIDGGQQQDLVTVPSGTGYLSWPAGDWIYYNKGGREKEEQKSKIVMKVNYKTGESVEAFQFKYMVWQWTLSADGMRVSADVDDDNAAYNDHVRCELTNDGSCELPTNCPIYYHQGREWGCVAYGCNNAISPGGTYFCWTSDPSHANVQLIAWDGIVDDLNTQKENRILIGRDTYNQWAVNTDEIATVCGDKTVTVGTGFQGNRFSVNSDQWICMGLGWPGHGRFGECSSNQVLLNWKKEKTVMVSFNKRSCSKDRTVAECDKHVPDQVKQNAAGTFLVTGPEDEIYPDLRKYVDITDVSSKRQKKAATRQRCTIYMPSPHTIVVALKAVSQGGTVRLFDSHGRLIDTKQVHISGGMHGGVSTRVRFSDIRAGLYIAEVQTGAYQRSLSFVVPYK